MITLREAARGLLEAVVVAIEYGDWKVDGACDPTVDIVRLKNILAKPEPQWIGLTDEERDWCINGTAWVGEEKEVRVKIVEAIEAKLKEKNNG